MQFVEKEKGVRMRRNRTSAVELIWECVAGKKRSMLLLFVVQAFLGMSGVIQALLLRNAIDAAVGQNEVSFFYLIGVFSCLVLLQIAMRWLLRLLEESLKAGIENHLKQRMFSKLLEAEYALTSSVHSGEWMTRLTSDVALVSDGIVTIFPGIAGMVVRLLGALVMLIYLMPCLGLFLVGAGLIVLLFTYGVRKTLKRVHKEVQEADGSVRVFLQERLGSLMLVKVFQAESETEEDLSVRMSVHRTARMKKNRISNVCNTGFALAVRGLYLFGAIGCGYGILKGTVSYGTFTAVLQLINQMQTPLAGMSGYAPKYYAMLASAERITEPDSYIREEKTEEKTEHRSFRKICCNQIGFTYPGISEPVLKDLTVHISDGEFIAVTGDSGCGKSTFLKVLLGLYRETEGTAKVKFADGTEQELSENGCRKLFSYVPQGKHLLNGSIRDIVSLGNKKEKGNTEKIKNVLKIACAEFTEELEQGIDTILGEQGEGLSEGQLQRISIARALFIDRPVLVLDEATSALDIQTEKRLLENIRQLRDKTVIIVTHRPAVFEVCDRIIHIEKYDSQGKGTKEIQCEKVGI